MSVSHNLALRQNGNAYYTRNTAPTITYTFNKEVAFIGVVNGKYFTADSSGGGEYSQVWNFTPAHNEGPSTISFLAMDAYGNEIKSTDYLVYNEATKAAAETVKDAILAFTLDTGAPVLTFSRSTSVLTDQTTAAAVSNQTVFCAANGGFTAKGLTEPGVTLTIAPAAGVTAQADGRGIFTISGSVGTDEGYREFTVTAADAAGNRSQAILCVINPSAIVYKALKLKNGGKADADFAKRTAEDGISITGYHYIELEANTSVDVSIFGVTEGNADVRLSPDDVVWDVLYNANCISIDGGRVTAEAAGETAVMVTSVYSTFGNADGGSIPTGVSDILVIKVNDNQSDAPNDDTSAPPVSDEIFTVSEAAGEHGRINEGSKTRTVKKGSSVSIDFTPDDGCAAYEAVVNGKTYEASGTRFTIASVESNLSAVIHFRKALPFADVKRDDWFYDAVRFAFEQALFKGVSPTVFAPNGEMTRGMLATVLSRLAGVDTTGYPPPLLGSENRFIDVPENAWYAGAVAWAFECGLTLGTSERTFSPNEPITREQMVTMLMRYAEYMKADVSKRADMEGFEDSGVISVWAKGLLIFHAQKASSKPLQSM